MILGSALEGVLVSGLLLVLLSAVLTFVRKVEVKIDRLSDIIA